MIIECPACSTKFRLDESRIKGRGARVRCRRCGETIVALKPVEPQAPSPDAGKDSLDLRSVVRESMGEKPVEAPPETSPPAAPPQEKDEVDAAFAKFLTTSRVEEPPPSGEANEPPLQPDLSIDFRPEKKLEIDLPVESPVESPSLDFLRGGTGTHDISPNLREEPQDFLLATETPAATESPLFPSAEEPPREAPAELRSPREESEAPPPPPFEPQGGTEAFRPVAQEPRRAASPSPFLRPSVAGLLLLFVLLAGGGAYLGFTKGGQDLLQGLIPGMESLWLRGAGKPGPQYDVRNLIGYYEPNAAAGNLFVIKGQVANMGRTRKNVVRIHATLLDSKDHPILETTCYAGNTLPGETLRTASRAKIEESLSNRFGERLINMDIAPGKSVPFMVVFFNVPEGISAYRLEAMDGN
ncbi:MAG: DUF3426 domain-containing protein [Deltaproteobacteria bacterium]|nr:DUF3426 domain-containing protein [Candidatus Deferrimicrobiaceae bacterium]